MVMAKFTVDTANKLFIAKAGVTTFDVRVDLYSDAKEHWIADDAANKFTFPFINPATGRTTVQGGPEIDAVAGTVIPTYVFLENGWRVRPDEADHVLFVTGGVLLVQGGGDPYVDTLGDFTVRVRDQQPVQAIGVSQGAVIAPTQQQIRDALALAPTGGPPAAGSMDLLLLEIYRILGLDPTKPLVVGDDYRQAGAEIHQTYDDDGAKTTVTRT